MRLVILAIIVFALFAVSVAAGTLSCTSVSSGSPCPMGSTGVLKLYNTSDSHAAVPTDSVATVRICCTDTTGTNTIATTGTTFIRLAATTNSHVGFVGATNFTVEAKMNGSVEAINCGYTASGGSCTANTTCVMRTTDTNNAMSGTCGGSTHPYQVCCGFTAAVPTGDVAPPTTTATPTAGGSAYTWGTSTTQFVQVGYSCADNTNGTGCQTTMPLVCTGPTTCTPNVVYQGQPIVVTQPGTTFVCYRSVDTAGNQETVTCNTVLRPALTC